MTRLEPGGRQTLLDLSQAEIEGDPEPLGPMTLVTAAFGIRHPTMAEVQAAYFWIVFLRSGCRNDRTAEILGVNASTVSRWLRDYSDPPGTPAPGLHLRGKRRPRASR